MKCFLMKSMTLAFLMMLSMNVFAQEANNAEGKKFDWKTVPHFESQVIYLTDDDGNPLSNEDGTPQFRVLLRDQFGNYRSKESVKAQNKAIRKAMGRIAGKVGFGTIIGGAIGYGVSKLKGEKDKDAIVNSVVGGVVGGLAGYSFTEEDRRIAKEQKKSLKEQKKLIKAYSKTFTDEGIPVKAKANLTDVKGFDFLKGEPVSMAANDVKKELDSEAYNSTDTSAWDF